MLDAADIYKALADVNLVTLDRGLPTLNPSISPERYLQTLQIVTLACLVERLDNIAKPLYNASGP